MSDDTDRRFEEITRALGLTRKPPKNARATNVPVSKTTKRKKTGLRPKHTSE